MSLENGQNTEQQIPIILGGQILEPVHSYKYLGVELNSNLDFDQQWILVQTKIRSFPCLLKSSNFWVSPDIYLKMFTEA